MKYHIKFNGGNDEMLILSDEAFYGFIRVAVQNNRDITDFHVKAYRNGTPLYKTEYDGRIRYYTFEDFIKFFTYEGGRYSDLKMKLV